MSDIAKLEGAQDGWGLEHMEKEGLRPWLVQLVGEGRRGDLSAHSYLMGRKWGQTLPRGAQGVMGMTSRGGASQTLPHHVPQWPSRARPL